ncbi:hypothetical protein J6590_007382 [Homalodisca vitripennis]|nr:hypothetical protein J6590_007382 [Homalodisca vitripennis]
MVVHAHIPYRTSQGVCQRQLPVQILAQRPRGTARNYLRSTAIESTPVTFTQVMLHESYSAAGKGKLKEIVALCLLPKTGSTVARSSRDW